MYMLLKKVSGLKTWTYSLEDLYILFSVPSYYTEKFERFKSRVLDSPIKQINNLEEKEITVSYTVKKRGKKVRSIEFKIAKKAKEITKKNNKSPKSKKEEPLDEWADKNGIDRTQL